FKFCVLLMGGTQVKTSVADFVFFARELEDLEDRDRQIELSEKDLKMLNPNTRTCPIFRTKRDAELTKRIYRRVPILVDENRREGGNPWGVKFATMFHQTNDAELFRSGKELADEGFRLEANRWIKRKEVYLPLYEAKMIQAYDHRAASVIVEAGNWMRQGQPEDTSLVEHQNAEFVVLPRFWMSQEKVDELCDGPGWMLAYKDVTSPTNQRTMIAAIVPKVGLMNSAPFMKIESKLRAPIQCCLLANLNSIAYDFVARQKVGGLHLNFFIVEQLPTFPPDRYADKCPWDKKTTLEDWISQRVLKLTCTANDMVPLAEAAKFSPKVHRWNEDERAKLRAELDAAYFILYEIKRDDVEYILSQFQGIVNEDVAHGGVGQTRRLIRQALDGLGA
ncbi:MAG: Eco57I restriction-modification methylase domain-containing protein, partial [Tepidisphaeraceae bacterium]